MLSKFCVLLRLVIDYLRFELPLLRRVTFLLFGLYSSSFVSNSLCSSCSSCACSANAMAKSSSIMGIFADTASAIAFPSAADFGAFLNLVVAFLDVARLLLDAFLLLGE